MLRIARACTRTHVRVSSTHVERKRARWILVSQRRWGRAPSGTEKGARGRGRRRCVEKERVRERRKETVELHARDGSFIIAFSCVVCATVSCSLITMIHSRSRLPLSLRYVCHSVFVAMINLCTNPPLPEGRGKDTMHTNPQTSSPETERVSANTPRTPGESGAHYIY